MNSWVTVAEIATGINVVLLVALCGLWGRNYAAFRTKHTLGLLVFATFLLAENAVALYYYQADPMLSVWFSTAVPAVAWRAMLTLHIFEAVGLAFLTWVTWD